MNIEAIKTTWEKRQKDLGNTQRSVMLKNLPGTLNNAIHNKHIDFILGEIDHNAKNLLDVGCGWGRVSKEILKARPNIQIEGVELTEGYVKHFSKNVGSCFLGSVQNFVPDKTYDVIIIVTVLMYLDYSSMITAIKKLWKVLNANGKIICIEPSAGITTSLRKALSITTFTPTGQDVVYFSSSQLQNLFKTLKQSKLSNKKNIGYIPFLSVPTVHRALSVIKTK